VADTRGGHRIVTPWDNLSIGLLYALAVIGGIVALLTLAVRLERGLSDERPSVDGDGRERPVDTEPQPDEGLA
jgi:hypothetical protein